jgi:hypothetical protein
MTKSEPLLVFPEGVSSPRFIASADLHLGLKLYNNPDLENDLKDNLVRLCDLAIEKQVEYLVLAGDVYDDNKQDASTIGFVRSQVLRLAKAGITVVGIAGDHDKPVAGASWCAVSGVSPVVICPNFAGFDYYDYSAGMAQVLALLHHQTDAQKVQWLFLHCQFPQLFQFSEPKKVIDFSHVKIFDEFPNLLGVIAGDLHFGPEGVITDAPSGKEAYIGYCGSLGVTDIAESYNPRSVLYCDGRTLTRIEFPLLRRYVKVDFIGQAHEEFNPELYAKEYHGCDVKPVFYVSYDAGSEAYLTKLKPLYSLGSVVRSKKTRNLDNTELEVLDIRNDVKTNANVETALKDCCGGNARVFSLLTGMLASADPKQELDQFRKEHDI